MELVYPIYLDAQMMTAFLASLKGGVIEEGNIETKATKGKERSAKVSIGAKVSSLISAFIDAKAEASASAVGTEGKESQFKGVVRFPEASLFIELRNLLIEESILKQVNSETDFQKVKIGDLVEISGDTRPNPSYEVRRVLNQLTPVIVPMFEVQLAQLETQVADLKKLPTKHKQGSKMIQVGDQEFNLTDLLSYSETEIKDKRNQLVNIQALEVVVDKLFAEETSSRVIFESNAFNSVCKVYPSYARNGEVEEIFSASWRCVGKVIGKLEKSETFNLFKGLPVGLIAKEISNGLFESMKTDELEIEISDPVLHGPTLIIAALAIFA